MSGGRGEKREKRREEKRREEKRREGEEERKEGERKKERKEKKGGKKGRVLNGVSPRAVAGAICAAVPQQRQPQNFGARSGCFAGEVP